MRSEVVQGAPAPGAVGLDVLRALPHLKRELRKCPAHVLDFGFIYKPEKRVTGRFTSDVTAKDADVDKDQKECGFSIIGLVFVGLAS